MFYRTTRVLGCVLMSYFVEFKITIQKVHVLLQHSVRPNSYWGIDRGRSNDPWEGWNCALKPESKNEGSKALTHLTQQALKVETTLNQRWTEFTTSANVETTLHFWRCIYNVVSTSFQRCFNVVLTHIRICQFIKKWLGNIGNKL